MGIDLVEEPVRPQANSDGGNVNQMMNAANLKLMNRILQEGAVGIDLFEEPVRPQDNSGVGSLDATWRNIQGALSTGESAPLYICRTSDYVR